MKSVNSRHANLFCCFSGASISRAEATLPTIRITDRAAGAGRRKVDGSTLKGPRFVVPLVGCIVEMVFDPYGFWERQRECVPRMLSICPFCACHPL